VAIGKSFLWKAVGDTSDVDDEAGGRFDGTIVQRKES